MVSTGDALTKADMLLACKLLNEHGYELFATGGTYKYLVENSIPATKVLWPSECDNPNFKGRFKPALEMIQGKEVDMVINIPKDFSELELSNGCLHVDVTGRHTNQGLGRILTQALKKGSIAEAPAGKPVRRFPIVHAADSRQP